jgi:hypothetical protein
MSSLPETRIRQYKKSWYSLSSGSLTWLPPSRPCSRQKKQTATTCVCCSLSYKSISALYMFRPFARVSKSAKFASMSALLFQKTSMSRTNVLRSCCLFEIAKKDSVWFLCYQRRCSMYLLYSSFAQETVLSKIRFGMLHVRNFRSKTACVLLCFKKST